MSILIGFPLKNSSSNLHWSEIVVSIFTLNAQEITPKKMFLQGTQ